MSDDARSDDCASTLPTYAEDDVLSDRRLMYHMSK